MKNTFDRKTINFIRTDRGKRGVPCIWETMQLYSGIMKVTKVYDEFGSDIDSIYISMKNKASLVAIKDNFYIVKIYLDHDDVGISILRILDIDKYSNEALAEIVYRKSQTDKDFVYNTNAKEIEEAVFNKIKTKINDILDKLGI